MDFSNLAAAVLVPSEVNAAPKAAAALPSDLVTERFNALMSAKPEAVSAIHAVPNNFAVSSMGSLQDSQTLGNQILAGLHKASTEYAEKWKNVKSGLDAMMVNPSTGNMLKVQAELLQASMQYELVSKAVSRSTQNIDTLVRMS